MLRWLIYTVLVGALPLLIRLLCYLMLDNPAGSAFSPIDIVFFGLTLNIANVNELNTLYQRYKSKKTKRTSNLNTDGIRGFSLILIIFLCFTLGLTYANDLTDKTLLNQSSAYVGAIFLSLASLAFSSYVISKIQSCHENS